ncbi:MAG: hypothetical protein V4568_05225 [Pseudomonadota bacterium]
MLNIISRSAKAKFVGGQIKVFQNLVKGLDKIGYSYVVNRRLDACEKLWIHDDVRALPLIKKLPPEIKVVVGPNLYVMPRDMPKRLDLRRATYLHPCAWAADIWKAHGFDLCPLRSWPVGIDTDMFSPVPHEDRKQVLIYHKHRDPAELEKLKSIVNALGMKHEVIVYGAYKQEDYLRALGQSKYVIWHGRHESQGIALQEALARDIPILLWDVATFEQFWVGGGGCYLFTESEKRFPVTAAPYFDSSCGIKIGSIDEMVSAIGRMENEWSTFKPRDFVVKNLSLEKQARELLDFYGDWQNESAYEANSVASAGGWRPPIGWVMEAGVRRLKGYLRLG